MRAKLASILIITLITASASLAQSKEHIFETWIGIQANALSSFQVNSLEHERGSSQGIALTIAHPDRSRFGIDLHLFRGFNSAVDFLYGGGFFYTFIQKERLRFKSGLNISKFAVNDYKQDFEVVGGKIEDQFPETFKPYLALEVPLNNSMQLMLQGGYRILRSDIGTVVEIVERYPNGTPSRVSVSEKQKYYGSGFELGFGLKVKLY